MSGERLLHKYRALAALRARREELERAGRDRFDREEAAERSLVFRALAAEFPGALRELDGSPASRLEARARELEAALAEGSLPRWAEVTIAYHHTLRDSLQVKAWLAGRLPRGGAVGAGLEAQFLAWSGRPSGMAADVLERHLRPPGGRLHALVWEALEARFGTDRAELEALVFGARRTV